MEPRLSYGSDYHYLPVTSVESGTAHEILPNVLGLTVQIVNVFYVGAPGAENWILVDAGMPGSADSIIKTAEHRFGADHPPKAIVLTHGHFDHVGSIIELIRYWKVPVFAHEAERPFLTGKKSYLPPDPSAGGGISRMSPWFPREPIDIEPCLVALPSDGTIPDMHGWRWIRSDGHTPGHISLFEDRSRALIAGDAFVTVKQESIYKVFLQQLEISGPPKYFTTDWSAAKESVSRLEALNPSVAATGHGLAMKGETLTSSLRRLVAEFDQIACPD